MAGDKDQSSGADPVMSKLSEEARHIRDLAMKIFEQNESIIAAHDQSVAARKKLGDYVAKKLEDLANPTRQELGRISSAQEKMRAVLLEKQDYLQGTMDLLRIDLRSNWNTADFAILNSRSVREEHDKMLDMISTMQKQQQMLAAQVEELRKNALDKGQSGS